MTTVTSQCLVEAAYLPNADATAYTSAASVRTLIDKFWIFNGTAGSVTATIAIVGSGGTSGVSNRVHVKSIAAGENYTFPEIVGNVLEPGDFVSWFASAATSLVGRISGRKVS